MAIEAHSQVTGFSGNEIFCLRKLNYGPGQLCLGNSVLALGVGRGLGAGLSNLAGGEITQITNMIHEGRLNAYKRLVQEAKTYGGVGIAGVSFDVINHGGNLEFLAIGSAVRDPSNPSAPPSFSTSANAQQLYCQMDSGFAPHRFVFGNVAYSIGVGGNIMGGLRSFKRGEVSQYTEIFDRTRHLALSRIKDEAKKANANAVIGIETAITPMLGVQEMMMIGTASSHPALAAYAGDPVTSDLTNEELWNLVNIGYMPISLVMGVSVYSLGFTSGIMASLKSLVGGEVGGLTEFLYEAREKALGRVQDAARACSADEVVGVKTRVYDLGGGMVEFMVIGTAVKKFDGVSTKNENLPPQAIIQDRETFVDTTQPEVNLNKASAASSAKMQRGPLSIIFTVFVIIAYVTIKILALHHR